MMRVTTSVTVLLLLGAVVVGCNSANTPYIGSGMAYDAGPATEGSLAACAARYRGFETCCVYDEESDIWSFENQKCDWAVQCRTDVDCPAGFYEDRERDGTCQCQPMRFNDCRVEGERPVYVGPGEACPEGHYRCPWSWPDDGEATCTLCPCEQRAVSMDLDGTLYCPEDQDLAGCPCDGGDECCLTMGEGLGCWDGVWQFFWDCPCAPEEFGCEGALPDLCRGAPG